MVVPSLCAIVIVGTSAFGQVANDKPRPPESKKLNTVPPPNMPAMPTPPAGSAAPVVTPVPDAPTPREIWDRFIEACGGKEALHGKGSRTTKGNIEIPSAGMKGSLTTFAKAPNRIVQKTALAQFGEMEQGYNGTDGWSNDMMSGPRLLEGPELESFRRDAMFDGPFAYLDHAGSASTLGSATFADKDCWVVELKEAMGGDLMCYLDRKDGFLRGMRMVTDTPMGKMPVEMVIAEYGSFGPVKMPSKSVTRVMMQEFTISVDDVSFDEIDDAVFTPPPGVQALIDAKKKGAGSGAPASPGAPGAPGAPSSGAPGTPGSPGAPAKGAPSEPPVPPAPSAPPPPAPPKAP